MAFINSIFKKIRSSVSREKIQHVKGTSIIDLPNELLAKIINELGDQSKNARLVCSNFDRAFCQSIQKATLNNNRNFHRYHSAIRARFLPSDLSNVNNLSPKFFSNLLKLEISGCEKLTKLPKFENLKELDLHNLYLPRNFFSTVHLPHLELVRIENCFNCETFNPYSLDSAEILDFLNAHPKLDSLTLSGINFKEITRSTPEFSHRKLRTFKLAAPLGWVDQALSHIFCCTPRVADLHVDFTDDFNGSCLFNVTLLLSNLKKLTIRDLANNQPLYLDRIIDPNFQNLLELTIKSDRVDDHDLAKILRRSKNLEKIELICSQLSGSFFSDELLNFDSLKAINLDSEKLVLENFSFLVEKAKKLSSAKLCGHRFDETLRGDLRKYLFNLKEIDSVNNFEMNEKLFSQIIKYTANLKSADLRFLEISDEPILEMMRCCQKIEKLRLSFLQSADSLNVLLASLKSELPNLKCLDLSRQSLDHESWDLISQLTSLEKLCVRDTELNDTIIQTELPRLKNLKEIFLPLLATDNTLSILAEKMPLLSSIIYRTDKKIITELGIEKAINWASDMGRNLRISSHEVVKF